MRIQMLAVITVVGAAIFLANASAIAHHSFAAEYDANKPVTFVGTVTKMEWINPHAWIHLDVKKPDGTVENWAVEAGPPGTLVRAGFNRNSLPPGTVIKVNGYRAKDGGLRVNGRDLTFPDGRLLFVGGSSPGAPTGGFPGDKAEQKK